MSDSFQTHDLAIGYNKKILLQDIQIHLEPGTILTLIGPNGAGKSTLLKTITRQLAPISGEIYFSDLSVQDFSAKEFAQKTAVVLTERVNPELMTCAEVVAMGRYPYTDMFFGKLSDRDQEIVWKSLERVHALEIANQDFSTLSDGQKQRILLARAICQEPEILILDEPTAYLDIRYKIELLEILQEMARSQGTIVIMSLHEIDLAMKISDQLLCMDGKKIISYGAPKTILSDQLIRELYGIGAGSYNMLFGSVELPKPEGEPVVFVIAGNGKGTPFFRELQKKGIPFAAGILFENDIDCQTAEALSDHVITAPAFEPVSPEIVNKAIKLLSSCKYVLDSGAPVGIFNQANAELIHAAKERKIPIIKSLQELD